MTQKEIEAKLFHILDRTKQLDLAGLVELPEEHELDIELMDGSKFRIVIEEIDKSHII
ncbi:MAG: hypothetical protein PHS82_07160 [Lachnospiraceae bacterium]|nr:hypothetical protein [Lachnospiraceae bacterium]